MFGHKIQKNAGEIEMADADGNVKVFPIKQCCHCGRHWIAPAQGEPRMVFNCTKCGGAVCGPECETCYPFEQRVEDYEKGLIRSL